MLEWRKVGGVSEETFRNLSKPYQEHWLRNKQFRFRRGRDARCMSRLIAIFNMDVSHFSLLNLGEEHSFDWFEEIAKDEDGESVS